MADPTQSERDYYRHHFRVFLAHRWPVIERNLLRLERYHRPRRNFGALMDAADRVVRALTRGYLSSAEALDLAVRAGVPQRTEAGKALRQVWLNELREAAQDRFYGRGYRGI